MNSLEDLTHNKSSLSLSKHELFTRIKITLYQKSKTQTFSTLRHHDADLVWKTFGFYILNILYSLVNSSFLNLSEFYGHYHESSIEQSTRGS